MFNIFSMLCQRYGIENEMKQGGYNYSTYIVIYILQKFTVTCLRICVQNAMRFAPINKYDSWERLR